MEPLTTAAAGISLSSALATAASYGVAGVVSVALGAYLLRRESSHAAEIKRVDESHVHERKEWREAMEHQHNEALQQAHRSNVALDNNTRALARLETIITSRSER